MNKRKSRGERERERDLGGGEEINNIYMLWYIVAYIFSLNIIILKKIWGWIWIIKIK